MYNIYSQNIHIYYYHFPTKTINKEILVIINTVKIFPKIAAISTEIRCVYGFFKNACLFTPRLF